MPDVVASLLDNIIFTDTETTGLSPDQHEIWEVAAISGDSEYLWQLPVDLSRADHRALEIGHFYERRQVDLASKQNFAQDFARLTRNKHLCGAVVSFDEERLRRLLLANGACPGWHYHLIEVENLAIGHLAASGTMMFPPWNSEEVSKLLGVDVPDGDDRHTALGDAKWARRMFCRTMGIPLA
jgi:hypothetical protein